MSGSDAPFQIMSEDPYEVQVLHFINPHQVWVRPLKPEPPGDRWRVEQVGVFGLMARFCCIEPELDRVVMATSASWPPAAAAEMRRFFRARTLWFSPTLQTAYSHTILDSNLYKLGEFYAQESDDTFRELSQVLQDRGLATYDPQTFTNCLESGSLPLKLNTAEINNVLMAIDNFAVDIPAPQWKAMVRDQMHVYFHHRRFENEIKEKFGSLRSTETRNIIANKEADFEFCCKGVDYEFLMVKDKLENHKSVSRKLLVERIKAAKKKGAIMKEIMGKKNISETTTGNAGIGDREKSGNITGLKTKLRVNDKIESYRDHWRGDDFEEDIQINDRKYFSNVGEDSFLDKKMLNVSSSSDEPTFDLESSINALKFAPKGVKSSKPMIKKFENLNSQSSVDNSTPSSPCISNRLKTMKMAVEKKHLKRNVSTTESSEHETSTDSDVKELKSEVKHLDKTRSHLMEKFRAIKEQQKYEIIDNMSTKQAKEPRKICIEEIVESPKRLMKKIAQNPTSLIKDMVGHPVITETSKAQSMSTGPVNPAKGLIEDFDDLDSPIQPLSIPKSKLEKKEDADLNIELLKNENNKDLIQKMLTPQLMIHSKNNVRIKPVIELKNIHFTNKIHKTLINMGNKIPLSLQTVSWPCILRGYSFFTVNPKGSNKAMGYAPAVCRLVVDNKDTHNAGPICIIVCDTARSVDEVVGICNTFLKGDKIVLFCYAGVDRNQLTKNLLNGCDILVCTPFYLSELFSYGHFSLDLSCLSIVVLDGCDRINNLYAKEFRFFYSQINKMLSIRVNKHHQVQFIATANEWCNLMFQLSMKVSNSVVCFGSFQECVVYSKVYTSVVFDMVGSKLDTLVGFLKEADATKRTVIVCKTNVEVAELEQRLTALKYTVLTGGTNLSIQQVGILNDQWFQYKLQCIAPILVCCDENLRYLNITNAHYLVHFSLPATFASFCRRFAVLIDNIKSIFDDDSKSEVKVKILCDSENTEQLPKLLHFMKRCTNTIPEILNEISDKILIEKDRAKAISYTPVCDNLLALGECPDFWYCNKRHTFCPVRDNPTEWVPKNGRISFKILHYHTAVHYSAELTSLTVEGKKMDLPLNGSKKIAMKINIYFCNEDHRKVHGVPEPGDICAVSTSGYYERCQVIKILTYYDNGKPKHVVVNLIDEEKEHIVSDVELLHLPEQFKSMLSYVVQIRLGNLRPKDKDVSFSEMSKDFLVRLLKEEERTYLRAKIALVVGNTIIVEDLEACQDMSTTCDTVVRCRVKEALCVNHTEPNENHIPKLIKLCETSGFKLPMEEEGQTVLQKELKLLPKPQWAHLESDDFPLVYFSSAKNPGKFYIRLVRFEVCLDNLTKDIQKHTCSIDNKEEVQEFEKGDYVLAKFPDDLLYYRARIDELSNKDNKEKLKCFFVDHGEWRSIARGDVRPITDYFITVMPFQAIECRLIGLQPVGQEWNDWSTNYFIDQCFQDAANDSLKELYVKYLVKEPAESTEGHKYGIIIIDTSSDEDVIINNLMLEANVADMNEAEKHFLENIEFEKPNKAEVSDEDSDIIDEEWRKEAAPFKDVIYERKLELPIEREFPQPTTLNQIDFNKIERHDEQGKTSNCSSFDSDAFDVVYSDDDCYEILGLDSKRAEKKPLLQLTESCERVKDTNTTNKTESSTVTSSCSSYEVMGTPQITELDSDDLSSSENSGIITKLPNNYPTEHDVHSTISIKHTPKLSWHQTKTSVTVKIEISEIVNYKLDIDQKSMTFETYAHDTEYGFTVRFYGLVVPDKCSHYPKGLYVLIKLTKLLKNNWLDLTEGDKKRWITYDPDSVGADLKEEDGDMVVMKKELDDFVKERAVRMDDDDHDDIIDDDDYFGDYS